MRKNFCKKLLLHSTLVVTKRLRMVVKDHLCSSSQSTSIIQEQKNQMKSDGIDHSSQ